MSIKCSHKLDIEIHTPAIPLEIFGACGGWYFKWIRTGFHAQCNNCGKEWTNKEEFMKYMNKMVDDFFDYRQP